ncbi:hypothetical protein L1766_01615 [Thermovorax subterraneus]|nr:hypothetical protein [Thermovorax subterraneus]
MRGIKDCGSLVECDRYLEGLLESLGNTRLLGYIELDADEIKYMANLISKELAKPYF